MQKVREEKCNSEAEYKAVKPKNATQIFFKQMADFIYKRKRKHVYRQQYHQFIMDKL